MKTEQQYFQLYKGIRETTNWSSKFKIMLDELNRSLLVISPEIGVSYDAISCSLNGKYIPSYLMLMGFVRLFHVNPEWLFQKEGSSTAVLTDDLRKRDSEKVIDERILCLKGADHHTTFSSITDVSIATSISINKTYTGKTAIRLNESTIRKIAQAYNVGFEWLLCGDEKCKNNPVNHTMIDILWSNLSLREEIWKKTGRDIIVYSPSFSQELSLGARIRYCRKAKGLSIQKLSDISFISYSTILRLEHDREKFVPLNLRRLAEVLCVGEDWLLHGDESRLNFPIDKRTIEFLKENPDVRSTIDTHAN